MISIGSSAAIGAIVLLGLLSCPALAQQTFEGYNCTADCSGHEAGYDWAERNGISDASGCDGNSQSFNEGCQAYVDEQHPDDDEAPADEGDEDSSE